MGVLHKASCIACISPSSTSQKDPKRQLPVEVGVRREVVDSYTAHPEDVRPSRLLEPSVYIRVVLEMVLSQWTCSSAAWSLLVLEIYILDGSRNSVACWRFSSVLCGGINLESWLATRAN